MELKEMITKRKSFRKYTAQPVGEALLGDIMAFAKAAKPLLPHIAVEMQVVTKEQVQFMLPWKTPQLMAGSWENAWLYRAGGHGVCNSFGLRSQRGKPA